MRRTLVAVVVAISLLPLGGRAEAATLPSSMAATGDSITRAFNTGWFPFIDWPPNSWSTGSSSAVNSHYRRILASNPAIFGRNHNDARSGAKMADLDGQMTLVVSQNVEYVTVLMGGNDVCTSSEATMTDPATFRAQFTAAMDRLTAGLPAAKVFVASIPDAYRLWLLFKDNATARATWALFGICRSLLANPRSTAQEDVDRRARVRQRNIDLNAQLREVCALYVQCRYDGDAVFNTPFTTADVSSRDYFHPSVAGEAKLARVTWSVGYWGP